MDGLAWSNKGFEGKPGDVIYTAVFGIIDNGPESLRPMWPAIVRDRVPESDRRQVVDLCREHRSGPQCLPEEGKPGRVRAYQRRRVQHRRQDDVRRGLRRTLRELPDGIAVLHDAEVGSRLDDHEGISRICCDDPGGFGRRDFFCHAAISVSFRWPFRAIPRESDPLPRPPRSPSRPPRMFHRPVHEGHAIRCAWPDGSCSRAGH